MRTNTRQTLDGRTRLKVAGGQIPRGTQGAQAYQKLRALLKDGVLKPGERIVEATLAERLAVSRTPVRDAIRRLEAEGLLNHQPREGVVVARLDRRGVVELYEMREVLEGTAARLFTRHASDLEVEGLLDLAHQERRLQGKADELAAHNLRFHNQIHRGAHNRFLEKALQGVYAVRWLLGPSQMLTTDRAEEALAEHTELAQAILDRDAPLAESISRKHVRSAQRRRMKTLFPQED
ncbi:MAG TPA: GntR family transcriptional regulator [Stellaceae bacterium]|jgi:DNA-binding GntR family transcriptional regulator|nr:GntR family transcriptional regulator [Stellaceae bacterium]